MRNEYYINIIDNHINLVEQYDIKKQPIKLLARTLL